MGILPLAMLEPKYSMVSRLLCSLCALSVSPNRSPCSNDPAQLRIVMVLDQNSPTACMERRPVVFTRLHYLLFFLFLFSLFSLFSLFFLFLFPLFFSFFFSFFSFF